MPNVAEVVQIIKPQPYAVAVLPTTNESPKRSRKKLEFKWTIPNKKIRDDSSGEETPYAVTSPSSQEEMEEFSANSSDDNNNNNNNSGIKLGNY